MAEADRAVLLSAQLVLMREREVSQFLVDGLLGLQLLETPGLLP